MRYIDGYVIPVLKKDVDAYRRLAKSASKVFRKCGALAVCECVEEDSNEQFGRSFAKSIRLKRGETVVFSWVAFKSRAHRDKVNAAVMTDPLMKNFNPKKMPFDIKRMIYGGFDVIVNA